jgi:hypothetical protein
MRRFSAAGNPSMNRDVAAPAPRLRWFVGPWPVAPWSSSLSLCQQRESPPALIAVILSIEDFEQHVTDFKGFL